MNWAAKVRKKMEMYKKTLFFFVAEYTTSPREEACEGVMYEWVTSLPFP